MEKRTAQDVYLKIIGLKREIRTYTESLKNACKNNKDYVKLEEEKVKLTSKIRLIRAQINDQNPKEVEKLDQLRADLKDEKVLLSDILLNAYTKGEKIDVKDQYDQPMLPLFTVQLTKEK